MGSVLHPLNIRLGPKELTYIMGDAEDRICFVDYDLLPRLAAVSAAGLAPLRLGVVVCGPVYAEGGAGGPRWEDMPEPARAAATLREKGGVDVVDFGAFVGAGGETGTGGDGGEGVFRWPEDIDEHEASSMCYTSGTTGNPKGVVYVSQCLW